MIAKKCILVKEPTRVLHIVSSLERWGVLAVIMNYYRNIDRKKIQFDFLSLRDREVDDFSSEIESLGGKIYCLPYKLGDFNDQIKTRLKFLKEHTEYEIVHIHVNFARDFTKLYPFKRGGIRRIIAHSHSSRSEESWKDKYYRIFMNYLSTSKIACSQKAGEWVFGKKAFEQGKVKIVNNAIDIDKFLFNEGIRKSVRRNLNLEDNFVVGHVGRFSNEKNHEFIIKIFHEVYKKNKNAVLLLVGYGELESYIKKRVRELSLEEVVIFLGGRKDVNELLQAMDVFLLPSRYEGLPVVLVEAQTAGLKCFISDVITSEIKITDLIDYISLECSPLYWGERILANGICYERENLYLKLKESCFNIKTAARELEKIYLQY